MLSYMREQGGAGVEASGQDVNNANKSAVESGSQGQDYLTVAGKENQVRKTTTLLIILFVVGGLGLFLMIKKSGPQTASAGVNAADEVKIEKAISHLTGVSTTMLKRMDKIVNKFYEFSNVNQVEVDELIKNPFEHDMFIGNLKKTDAADESSVFKKQQIQKEADKLNLYSIIESDEGMSCMIDDKILGVGDTIKDFSIKAIDKNKVTLESSGVEIALKLIQ